MNAITSLKWPGENFSEQKHVGDFQVRLSSSQLQDFLGRLLIYSIVIILGPFLVVLPDPSHVVT